MIIEEFEDYLTKKKKYNIKIEQTDNIDPTELAMSFQEQFTEMAVITFSRVVKIEAGLIICNLKLRKEKSKWKNKN